MIRSFSFSIIILLLTVISSCNSSNKDGFAKYRASVRKAFNNLDTLHVDNSYEPEIIKYSEAIVNHDLSLDIEIIKLETKPEALIGYVGTIMHDDGKIFISDDKYHSLYIFSDDGRFIHRIHNIGNGPGEYNKLTDFTLDKKKKKIVLYDAQKKTYYYHRYDGTFIESKRFGLWFREFCITPSGNYLLYTNNGNRAGFRLFQTDSTGINVTKKALPWNKYFKMNAYSTPHLDFYKDEVLITYPFSYNTYAVRDDSLFCKYRLDLEGKDFYYDWEKRPGFDDYHDQFRNSNKKFYYGGNFIEDDQFALFFLYTRETGKSQTLAFNKKTGKTFKIKLTFPNTNLYIWPKLNLSNKFVGAVFPHDLIEHGLHKKYKELEGIHENDNPCLVLFSIKNK